MNAYSRLLYGAYICAVGAFVAWAQDAKVLPAPEPSEGLHVLAGRLLKYAEGANCLKTDCRLLVSNFSLPDGTATPYYGRQLADELSREIAAQEPTIRVIERDILKALLEKERIPSALISENFQRAIASELRAATVLVGTTRRLDENTVELSTRLLSVNNEDLIGYSAEGMRSTTASCINLSPSEPFASLPPLASSRESASSGGPVYRPGVEGVSVPTCTYMPNPLHSDLARNSRSREASQSKALSLLRVSWRTCASFVDCPAV